MRLAYVWFKYARVPYCGSLCCSTCRGVQFKQRTDLLCPPAGTDGPRPAAAAARSSSLRPFLKADARALLSAVQSVSADDEVSALQSSIVSAGFLANSCVLSQPPTRNSYCTGFFSPSTHPAHRRQDSPCCRHDTPHEEERLSHWLRCGRRAVWQRE